MYSQHCTCTVENLRPGGEAARGPKLALICGKLTSPTAEGERVHRDAEEPKTKRLPE